MNITRRKLVNLLKKSEGKIFTVTFTKKDGTTRVLNGRLGVQKYISGVGLSYDPAKFNLLPVFDLQKDAYRMVNLKSIQQLSVGRERYTVA